MKPTSEAAFETVIEAHLLDNGYVRLSGDGFDRGRAIFPEAALGFIRETQPREWARLEAFSRFQDRRAGPDGSLQVDGRRGSVGDAPPRLQVPWPDAAHRLFKAAHELNPELEARYAANRLGLTRQLRFSPRSEQSLDVTPES